MRRLNRVIVVVVALLCFGFVVGGESDHIELGFANIQTVRGAEQTGSSQHLTSGIIVRIFDKVQGREIFALSNEAGIAVVPLRPGSYCFDAFGHTGNRLDLDKKQSRCFSIRSGEIIELGVVLSHQSK